MKDTFQFTKREKLTSYFWEGIRVYHKPEKMQAPKLQLYHMLLLALKTNIYTHCVLLKMYLNMRV